MNRRELILGTAAALAAAVVPSVPSVPAAGGIKCAAGTWHHYCWSRHGDIASFFIDGFKSEDYFHPWDLPPFKQVADVREWEFDGKDGSLDFWARV